MADADSAMECFQALEQVNFECRSCWRVLCGEREGGEGGRGLEGQVDRGREGGEEVSSSLYHGTGTAYTPESHCPYTASLHWPRPSESVPKQQTHIQTQKEHVIPQ